MTANLSLEYQYINVQSTSINNQGTMFMLTTEENFEIDLSMIKPKFTSVDETKSLYFFLGRPVVVVHLRSYFSEA